MERHHGKPIDLSRLKARVLSDIAGQSSYWAKKAAQLLADTSDIRQCPICGGEGYHEALRIYGFPWRECEGCGHVFNGARPSPEALTHFYAADDEAVNHADDYTDPNVRAYRKDAVARPKVAFAAKYRPAPGRWLDVGCGNGDLLAVARELGYECVGLEPNVASARIGREAFGLDIREQLLGDYAADRAADFDVVSFIGLLDLVAEPMALLRAAAKLLKPGGIVFASFPNYGSLSTAVQATYPDRVICRHMYPATLNAYTIGSAERAFRDNGLEPEAHWFFGMDVYETLNNLQLGAPGFAGSPLHQFLFGTINEIQAVFDRLELCDKFHAIARKPG
jgi:2-polyprenyl-3-methyl-5-hydroxy-6-metoxy-1,4-benzoquinol methylase